MPFRDTYELDATQASRAVADLDARLDKMGDASEKAGKKLTKAERAAARLAKQADPQKKYNDQMDKLAVAVNKGGLEMNDARALAQRYGTQLERTGSAGKRAFGSQAAAALSTYTAQMLSLQAATSGTLAVLRELEQARGRASEFNASVRPAAARLAQLAVNEGTTTTQRIAWQNVRKAEGLALYAKGAFESPDRAIDAVYDYGSAGLSKRDRGFAGDLQAVGVFDDTVKLAQSYSALAATLGKTEVGTFEDLVDKALAVSKIAPAQAPELPLAASRAAGSAKALGIGDEFLLGSAAVLAKTTGSSDRAATQLDAFMRKIDLVGSKTPLLQGKTGLETLEALAPYVDDTTKLTQYLGNDNTAIQGARGLLNNLDLVRTTVADAYAGDEQGLAREAITVAGSDPELAASLEKRRAERRRVLRERRQGEERDLAEAVINDRASRRLAAADTYVSRFENALDGFAFNLQKLFGIEGGQIGAVDRPVTSGGFILSADPGPNAQLQERTEAFQQRQIQLLEQIATRPVDPSGGE